MNIEDQFLDMIMNGFGKILDAMEKQEKPTKSPTKPPIKKVSKQYYQRINLRKGDYKGLSYKRGAWENTENEQKIQFPAWCTYYSGKIDAEDQIRFGQINKRYNDGGGIFYQLVDVNEQTCRDNFVVEYCNLANLINHYSITIGEAKFLFREG